AGGVAGARIVGGNDPGGGAFGGSFGDAALAFEIEVFEELLAVVNHVIHGEQKAALLEVDVIAERPIEARQRGIGTIPGAAGGVAGDGAHAGIGAVAAEGLIEAADG